MHPNLKEYCTLHFVFLSHVEKPLSWFVFKTRAQALCAVCVRSYGWTVRLITDRQNSMGLLNFLRYGAQQACSFGERGSSSKTGKSTMPMQPYTYSQTSNTSYAMVHESVCIRVSSHTFYQFCQILSHKQSIIYIYYNSVLWIVCLAPVDSCASQHSSLNYFLFFCIL